MNQYRAALVVLAVSHLTACETIKSLFPDKEKDYQYTTQIAPLTLPDDLRRPDANRFAQGMRPAPKPVITEALAAAEDTIANTASAAVEPVEPLVDNTIPTPPPTSNLAKPRDFTAELLSDGTNRLRLSLPAGNAWRVVSKALSRKSIEVTKRDQAAGLFEIHYVTNDEKVKDDSFLDEMSFLFDGFQDEQAYSLKLQESSGQTEVLILDSEQKPLNDAASLKLLQLLQATIRADVSK
jgi:outer membrane protein assembly factor BamC